MTVEFSPKCLFVAVDSGARAAVGQLAKALGGDITLPAAGNLESVDFWGRRIREDRIEIAFVGTSDSLRGFAIERAIRQAAQSQNVPCVVIEDFPGNYRGIPEVRDSILIADGTFSLCLAQSSSPGSFALPLVLDGLRYDPLRTHEVPEARPTGKSVLWAGQPETTDAIATLAALTEPVNALDLQILFRAHPRDPGYTTGDYRTVLNGFHRDPVDVTGLEWSDCLALGPALLVTQFSSLAVEAGFAGLPAIHVLYRDIGQIRLQDKKGYAVPPICVAGGSWLIQAPGSERSTLEQALTKTERNKAIHAFSDHMNRSSLQMPKLLDYLYNHGLINRLS